MTDYWKNTIVEGYVADLDIPGYVILPKILPPPGLNKNHVLIQTVFNSMINCMTEVWCGFAHVILSDVSLAAVIYTRDKGLSWKVEREDEGGASRFKGSQPNGIPPNGSQPNASQTTCSELKDRRCWTDSGRPWISQPLQQQWVRLSNWARTCSLLMLFLNKFKPGEAEFDEIFGSAPGPMSTPKLRWLHKRMVKEEPWASHGQDNTQDDLESCWNTPIGVWSRRMHAFEECLNESPELLDHGTHLHPPAEKLETFVDEHRCPPEGSAHEPAPVTAAPSQTCVAVSPDFVSGAVSESEWSVLEGFAAEQKPADDFQPDLGESAAGQVPADDFQPDWDSDCDSGTDRGSQPEHRLDIDAPSPNIADVSHRRMPGVVVTARFSPYNQGVAHLRTPTLG